jgi:hypothetical protein
LLDLVRAKRAAFESSTLGITDEDYLLPGVAGHLSVKDILAHVTWWELRMLQQLNGDTSSLRQDDEDSDTAVNRVNRVVYAEHRDQALAEIQAASHASFQRVLESLTGFTEEHLRANLDTIAEDTYEHYEEHTADIRAWRGMSASGQAC